MNLTSFRDTKLEDSKQGLDLLSKISNGQIYIPIENLANTGRQYIDTGVIPTLNNSYELTYPDCPEGCIHKRINGDCDKKYYCITRTDVDTGERIGYPTRYFSGFRNLIHWDISSD